MNNETNAEYEAAIAKLIESRDLSTAWQQLGSREVTAAWARLKEYSIHTHVTGEPLWLSAQLRISDSGGIPPIENPATLTIYRDYQSNQCCRLAIWHYPKDQQSKLIDFVNRNGDVLDLTPEIETHDALIPEKELQPLLNSMAYCHIPPICLQTPGEYLLDELAPTRGLEYYSQTTPSTFVTYQWNDYIPPEWRPLIDRVMELRSYLMSLFDNIGEQ